MQKMRQIMTARNGKCSKQERISGVCVEGIQGKKCLKEENLTILCRLSANTMTKKCLKAPKSAKCETAF